MKIVGFGQTEEKMNSNNAIRSTNETAKVRSLVSISFESCSRALTYYNDQYDLKEGDRVFVSGEKEGEVGVVKSVTTKFRIRASEYQKVVSIAQTPIHGSYHPFADKMLSYDSNALAPDEFRKWILPPEDVCEMNDDIIVGDGYVIPLDEPGAAEDLDNPKVLDRAIEYCKEGAIGYVTIRDGIGKAFVEGTKWYEVDFELRNGYITEAYCGCPYPGLCKHLLAVAITLSIMSKKGDLDLNRDVTLIDATRFWKMIQHMGQSVTI